MKNNENRVKEQLHILQAHLRIMVKKVTETKEHFLNLFKKYKLDGQYERAFDSFNGFCSQYENERALNHLIECVQTIYNNLHEVLSYKSKPEKYDYELSIICYAQSVLHIPNLDYFVLNVVQNLWKKETVESLKFSAKIPDSMEHLIPRDRFTREELHLFAHTFENDLNMDFTWFYNNFPINSQNTPEQTSQVKVFGKAVFMKKVEAPKPTVIEYKGDASVLPALPPFKQDSYAKLNQFVEDSISKWNTWKFNV